jgi:hypothetical protein
VSNDLSHTRSTFLTTFSFPGRRGEETLARARAGGRHAFVPPASPAPAAAISPVVPPG